MIFLELFCSKKLLKLIKIYSKQNKMITLNTTSQKDTQPDHIYTKLKPHQLACLYKMKELEKDTNSTYVVESGFIKSTCQYKITGLSTKLGSGKSLMSLSICQPGEINLIIVPCILYKQWMEEIYKHTKLSVYGCDTTKACKDIKKTDIIICKETMMKNLKIDFHVKRLFIDEAHQIKSLNINDFSYCSYLYLISGTPEKLFETSGSRTNLIKYICQVPKERYITCDDDIYETHYNTENIKLQILNNELSVLEGLLTDNEISMVEGDAIQTLKETFGTEITLENVVISLIDKYSCARERYLKMENNLVGSKVKECDTKLRRLEELSKSMKDIKTCEIMFDELKDNHIMTTCCYGYFGYDAMNQWLTDHTTCPKCRDTNIKNNLVYIGKMETVTRKTKKQWIKEIIQNNRDKNILIASKYINDIKNDIPCDYGIINGITMKSKINVIDKLLDKEIQCILLDSEHNGSGLNLQMMDILIYYQKIDETQSKQILGRCLREGRDENRKLTIYEFE